MASASVWEMMPEQVTGLPHEGVIFRPLSPPLRREATIAWRADNFSQPLKDYVQIVQELSGAGDHGDEATLPPRGFLTDLSQYRSTKRGLAR